MCDIYCRCVSFVDRPSLENTKFFTPRIFNSNTIKNKVTKRAQIIIIQQWWRVSEMCWYLCLWKQNQTEIRDCSLKHSYWTEPSKHRVSRVCVSPVKYSGVLFIDGDHVVCSVRCLHWSGLIKPCCSVTLRDPAFPSNLRHLHLSGYNIWTFVTPINRKSV